MNQFIIFVKKEFKHIFRDKRTLFVLLGIPVAQILLFGFALTNEVKNSQLVIMDQSNDPASMELTEKLRASQYFNLKGRVFSPDEIDAAFKKGSADVAVVFPPDFEKSILRKDFPQVQVITDATDPNLANTLTNYVNAIVADFQMSTTGREQMPYAIQTEVRMLYNPQQKGAFNFVPGVMAMVMMLICTMMTSIAIVREKENGNMEVLLVSPLQPFTLIFAKAMPYLVLSLVNVTTILLLSVFVLEVPINGSLWLLYAESTLFIMTALSLGLLISTLTDSQMLAMFISLVGMLLPTVMLSGFLFPIENMPLLLQGIANLVPAKWFYIIVKSVMIKGLGLGFIWKETLVLLFMTTLFLIISWRKFSLRL